MGSASTLMISQHNEHVISYRLAGSSWVRRGDTLINETVADNFGAAMAMPDSNTLAIGAPTRNSSGGFETGQIYIYRYNGTTWIPKGDTIDGPSDYAGAGSVRIYTWNGSSWVQKGSTLIGIDFGGKFGYSVAMPHPDFVIVGAPAGDVSSTTDIGYVRVYRYNGMDWALWGQTVAGSSYNAFGHDVQAPDTHIWGASAHTQSGSHIGGARVYAWSQPASFLGTGYPTELALHISPNPVLSDTWIFGLTAGEHTYVIYDMLGRPAQTGRFDGHNPHLDVSTLSAGS